MPRIIWLASYPKSGNTWLRALLANYVLDRQEPISINELRSFTLSDTRPRFFDGLTDKALTDLTEQEVRSLRSAAQRRLADARPHDHFVKTHSQLCQYEGETLIEPAVTAGAIYVVRDPRDLVVSYAAHFGVDLDEAIRRIADEGNMTMAGEFKMTTYLGRWDHHVDSWCLQREIPVCMVRYEDLSREPEQAFGKVLATLGMPVTEERLKRAVRNSAFETMSKEEEKEGFVERPPHMERFFRSGKTGEGEKQLSDAQRHRIEEAFRPVMTRFGYLAS